MSALTDLFFKALVERLDFPKKLWVQKAPNHWECPECQVGTSCPGCWGHRPSCPGYLPETDYEVTEKSILVWLLTGKL